MKFTDVEIMSFVDDDCDDQLKQKIENQLRNDFELAKRIEKFQRTNNTMGELIKKQEEMPIELLDELKALRTSSPEMKKKHKIFQENYKKSIDIKTDENIVKNSPLGPIERITEKLGGIFENFLGSFLQGGGRGLAVLKGYRGVAVAGLAGVIFLAIYNFQDDENLAKDYFAAIKNLEGNAPLIEKTSTKFELAGIEKVTDTVFRSSNQNNTEFSKDVQNTELANSFKVTVFLGQEDQGFELPDGGLVSDGVRLKLEFTAPFGGDLAIYNKSVNKKELIEIITRANVPKGWEMSLPPSTPVEGPYGLEYFQIIFNSTTEDGSSSTEKNKSRTILSTTFDYQIVDRENLIFSLGLDEKFEKGKNKEKFESKILAGILTGEKTKMPRDNCEAKSDPQIWQEGSRYFVDLTGDGFANVILYDLDQDGNDDFSVDRNCDQKLDAVIKAYRKGSQVIYQWYLDDDQNGIPDGIADDLDGDWEVDRKYGL